MTIRGSKIIQKGRDRIPAFSFCRISFAATAYEFLPRLGQAIGESGPLPGGTASAASRPHAATTILATT
jgi:hypothetical protein